MRLLLDTHAVIWAVEQPYKLSPLATQLLENTETELLVSAATIWEVAIKVGLGKLTLSCAYHQWMTQALSALEATLLPVAIDYAEAQVHLANFHRDPFDRFLAAQAKVEGIALVSCDALFDRYGISRIW